MTERARFEKLTSRWQPAHPGFCERPHLSRRHFFRTATAGFGGFWLTGPSAAATGEATTEGSVQPKGTAKNVILIFLRGGPSHVDTFDFKEVSGVTPKDFKPEQFNGVTLPVGLLGRTSQLLDKIAIIRSGLAWARAHPLAQIWMQIGRDPTTQSGRLAPNVGSVVALEKEPERLQHQAFPTFIALQPGKLRRSGMLPDQYSPLEITPAPDGLAAATHPGGLSEFKSRWELMQALDAGLSGPAAPFGDLAVGRAAAYGVARNLTLSPNVAQAFQFTEEDSERYGGTAAGNAYLLAKNIIEQDQGTRFIHVEHNGWDQHGGIYGKYELYRTAREEFDPAFSALISDLDALGKLDETLVVVCGEFGRTPGQLSAKRNGRDHYLQMFFVLAGGGIRGGTVIGETNDFGPRPGAFTTEPGWHRNRDIRPEDIEATIYSALGIDWTTVRYDELGRPFRYVPLSDHDVYSPVDELWPEVRT